MRLLSDEDRQASTTSSTPSHRHVRPELFQYPFLYDAEDQPVSTMHSGSCSGHEELQTPFLSKVEDTAADSGRCSLPSVLRNIFCNFTLSPAMMRKIK